MTSAHTLATHESQGNRKVRLGPPIASWQLSSRKNMTGYDGQMETLQLSCRGNCRVGRQQRWWEDLSTCGNGGLLMRTWQPRRKGKHILPDPIERRKPSENRSQNLPWWVSRSRASRGRMFASCAAAWINSLTWWWCCACPVVMLSQRGRMSWWVVALPPAKRGSPSLPLQSLQMLTSSWRLRIYLWLRCCVCSCCASFILWYSFVLFIFLKFLFFCSIFYSLFSSRLLAPHRLPAAVLAAPPAAPPVPCGAPRSVEPLPGARLHLQRDIGEKGATCVNIRKHTVHISAYNA